MPGMDDPPVEGTLLHAVEQLHAHGRELRDALSAAILAHPWQFAGLLMSYFPILWIVEWYRSA